MLREWLSATGRCLDGYERFHTIDVLEVCTPTAAIKEHLRDLYSELRFPPGFLEDLAADIGWETAAEALAYGMPRRMRIRRGEFGELLAVAIWEEFNGYSVPVPKLRFKLSPDQSLPLTDIIAISTNSDGSILDVCYCEAKLRTVRDNRAALEAHQQLVDLVGKRFPEILLFVGARLLEQNHALYEPFRAYMRSRQESYEDRHDISLIWERDEWSEVALEELDDLPPALSSLGVHAVRIEGLADLVDEILLALGAEIVNDAV